MELPDTNDPINDSAAQQPENLKPMGLIRRVAGVFWAGPQKTFEDIVAAPKITGIVTLLLVLNIAFIIPILPKVREFTIWTLQNSPSAGQISAEAFNLALTWAAAAALLGAAAGPLLMWLVMAGLLKLYNSFSGVKTSFLNLLAVAVYSYLPVLLATIIKYVLILTTPAQNLNWVSTSLALVLPERMDRLYMIFSQIDPFNIWSLALLAVGSSVAMKISVKKTAVYIGSIWLIYVLAVGLLTPINRIAGY